MIPAVVTVHSMACTDLSHAVHMTNTCNEVILRPSEGRADRDNKKESHFRAASRGNRRWKQISVLHIIKRP